MLRNGMKKRENTEFPGHSNPAAAGDEENKVINVKPLPADLILEIFCRTAVKPLVRCKCVCKSWFALIDHSKFIKMHLDFNSSTNKRLLCNSKNLIASLSLSHPPIPVLYIDRDATSTGPDYPRKINFIDFSKNMLLAGSINGVVCLAHLKEMSGRFVALWNPSINHWNPIAVKVEIFMVLDYVSVGFGYDEETDDYKIICLLPSFGTFGWSFVKIYSANQGCWKPVPRIGENIVSFCPDKDLRRCSFIIKGVPYWEGLYEGEEVPSLGKINPCTGSYTKISYPQHVKNTSTKAHAVNLRDSVAALIQSPGKDPNQIVDLYVLDESTAKWTKMYSIGPLAFQGLQIRQCFSTGEIVLETWTGNNNHASNTVPYFCNPKTNLVLRDKEIEELDPVWYESYTYVESLVCVKGMVQIGEEHKDNEKTNSNIKNWTKFLPKEIESALH